MTRREQTVPDPSAASNPSARLPRQQHVPARQFGRVLVPAVVVVILCVAALGWWMMQSSSQDQSEATESAAQPALPEVPAFDELGFSHALDVIRQHVLEGYQQWQQQPLDASRNGRLGMLLAAYGKHSFSEVLYRRAHMMAPNEFRWRYYLAMATVKSGRYAEAVGLLREALKLQPDYISARIQLAGLLLQLNNTEESVALYREITAADAERIEGWLGLGKALHRSGDIAAAKDALQRASNIGPQYGEVHYALASVLGAGGDEDAAARQLALYQSTAKNKIDTNDPLMREVFWLNAGDARVTLKADYFLQQGEFQQAVESYRAALAINPDNQNAWGGLVQSLARLGQFDQAGVSYQQALAAGINYRRLHLTYGKELMQRQQIDEAREVITKAIELDPQYGEALLTMGQLELRSGAGSLAVDYFRRALEVWPNDRRLMLYLTKALNAAGQYDEAVTRLRPLTTDPASDISFAYMELATALFGLGQKHEAIEALHQSRDAASAASNTRRVNAIDAMLAELQAETVKQ